MSPLLVFILGILFGIILFYIVIKIVFKGKKENPPPFFEKEAEKILEAKGFKILGKQKSAPVVVFVEGKTHLSTVYVDFTAEKENKKFVIKVSNEEGFDPLEDFSRRTLLEIKNLFPKHELLVLNLSTGTLFPIKFEFPKKEKELFFGFALSLSIVFLVFFFILMLIQLKLI